MTSRQRYLVGAALLLVVVMALLVAPLTSMLGPLRGYLAVFAIYWIGFCLPVALTFGRGPETVSLTLSSPTRPWVPIVALGLPVAAAFGGGLFSLDTFPYPIVALALLAAAINGPMEELAWRRSFRANSGGRLSFELFGLVLFVLWHVPLLRSAGIAFEGGAVGLIGGAAAVGAIWMLMVRATHSVGWAMVSHALLNAAVFVPHFVDNFAHG
ncbi:MAG: CPBP family glutamic-type intramembrane protease [Hyphomicrobiaceae bacterium]